MLGAYYAFELFGPIWTNLEVMLEAYVFILLSVGPIECAGKIQCLTLE